MAQHLGDPYEAARALVSQAYKLWLQRETRTDDITAVVLLFDWPKEEEGEAAEQQPEQQQQPAEPQQGESGGEGELSEPQTPSSKSP